MDMTLRGWGAWQPARDDDGDALARRGHSYEPLVDFIADDALDVGLALLADRMCDVAEAMIIPELMPDVRGCSGRIECMYVTNLACATGRYIPGTWRTPVIVLDLTAISATEDPVATVAMCVATALAVAWGEARRGRGDVDEQARISADAYRTLIDQGTRGSSMPART